MSNEEQAPQAMWLAIVAKALAYLCLQEAQSKEPEKFDSVLKRVRFLEGLGLSRDHAAGPAGSSAESVRELDRLAKKRAKNGTPKKKGRR